MGVSCVFCASQALYLKFPRSYNKRESKLGQFDIYKCVDCQSLTTHPLPSSTWLRDFYGSASFGIDRSLRRYREEDPQRQWYLKIVNLIAERTGFKYSDRFTWLELGPGQGELAELMLLTFPNSKGTCLDFHGMPSSLEPHCSRGLTWLRTDLNEKFPVDQKFDLVLSISVLEHVLDVNFFCNEVISRCRDGGQFLLIAPNVSSMVAGLMGRYWPYFLPGEHLHVPSVSGLKCLIKRTKSSALVEIVDVFSILIPYTVRYVAQFFKVPFARMIPAKWSIPFPVGALVAWGKIH